MQRATYGPRNGSGRGISHMQVQILLQPTKPFGKALHTLPRSRRYSRLTAPSFCGRASVALAIRRLLNRRGASSFPLSSLFTFSTYTRPLLSAQPAYAHKDQQIFSSSSLATMAGKKIDGTAIAKSIRERLHAEIKDTQKTNPRFKPSLKIIQGN